MLKFDEGDDSTTVSTFKYFFIPWGLWEDREVALINDISKFRVYTKHEKQTAFETKIVDWNFPMQIYLILLSS